VIQFALKKSNNRRAEWRVKADVGRRLSRIAAFLVNILSRRMKRPRGVLTGRQSKSYSATRQ
jgi:hypothetical protein